MELKEAQDLIGRRQMPEVREAVVRALQEWVADGQPRVTVFELADRIMEIVVGVGFDPSAPAGFGDKRAVPGA